jgi:hypothetical protein
MLKKTIPPFDLLDDVDINRLSFIPVQCLSAYAVFPVSKQIPIDYGMNNGERTSIILCVFP